MQFLLEHIRLMRTRITYLEENKIKNSLQELLESYYKFYKKVNHYELKWIKYKLRSNSQSLNSHQRKESIEVLKLLKSEYKKLIEESIRLQ